MTALRKKIDDALPKRDSHSSPLRTESPAKGAIKFDPPLLLDSSEPLEVDLT